MFLKVTIGREKRKRRRWKQEVYMTPTITEANIKPIGSIQEHAEDTLSKATIAKVNDRFRSPMV